MATDSKREIVCLQRSWTDFLKTKVYFFEITSRFSWALHNLSADEYESGFEAINILHPSYHRQMSCPQSIPQRVAPQQSSFPFQLILPI
jgi:hypothetical protein